MSLDCNDCKPSPSTICAFFRFCDIFSVYHTFKFYVFRFISFLGWDCNFMCKIFQCFNFVLILCYCYVLELNILSYLYFVFNFFRTTQISCYGLQLHLFINASPMPLLVHHFMLICAHFVLL